MGGSACNAGQAEGGCCSNLAFSWPKSAEPGREVYLLQSTLPGIERCAFGRTRTRSGRLLGLCGSWAIV